MTARHSFCLQNIKISFEYVDSYAKSYWFICPSFENFTTKVTITEAYVTTLISDILASGAWYSPHVSRREGGNSGLDS